MIANIYIYNTKNHNMNIKYQKKNHEQCLIYFLLLKEHQKSGVKNKKKCTKIKFHKNKPIQFSELIK